jgi:hypothetical protein
MAANEFILNLINISPAFGVLFWMVMYFKAQLKEKDAIIKELNNENRLALKDAYNYMNEINITLKEFLK